jgi:hypothetical protein
VIAPLKVFPQRKTCGSKGQENPPSQQNKRVVVEHEYQLYYIYFESGYIVCSSRYGYVAVLLWTQASSNARLCTPPQISCFLHTALRRNVLLACFLHLLLVIFASYTKAQRNEASPHTDRIDLTKTMRAALVGVALLGLTYALLMVAAKPLPGLVLPSLPHHASISFQSLCPPQNLCVFISPHLNFVAFFFSLKWYSGTAWAILAATLKGALRGVLCVYCLRLTLNRPS